MEDKPISREIRSVRALLLLPSTQVCVEKSRTVSSPVSVVKSPARCTRLAATGDDAGLASVYNRFGENSRKRRVLQ